MENSKRIPTSSVRLATSSVRRNNQGVETTHHPLWEKTRRALAELGIRPDSKLLVGISGGPDSMALLHVLLSLKEQGAVAEVTIAHVNHLLRSSESNRDEQLVQKYAESWNVPIETKRVQTKTIAARNKTGIEETARDIRYKFFQSILKKKGFQFVVTAHTANDQAETILMNMMRGTGVRGLSGIPQKRKLGGGFVIRPWLSVTKNEIEKYLAEYNIDCVYDSSNSDVIYQRNRVRKWVIPAIRTAYPSRSPEKSLSQLANRMRDLDAFLNTWTKEQLDTLRSDNGLLLSGLKEIHGYPLYTILETWINTTPTSGKIEKYGVYRLTDAETRKIGQFLASDSSVLELRKALRLRKDSGILHIERDTESLSFEPSLLLYNETCATPYGTFSANIIDDRISIDSSAASFDADKLTKVDRLLVRSWKKGDLIAPFGMRGHHKLISDLLTEAKITGKRRRHYPVVECEGCILWIPGIRAANIASVTPSTKRMLQLHFEPAIKKNELSMKNPV